MPSAVHPLVSSPGSHGQLQSSAHSVMLDELKWPQNKLRVGNGRTSTEVSGGWQREGGESNQNALEIVLILSKTSLLNKTIKSLSLNG